QDDRRRTEARLARAGHRLAEQELTTCRRQVEAARAEIDRLQSERSKLDTRQNELASSVDAVDREVAEAGGAAAVKFKEELDAKKIAFARLDQNLSHLREAGDALSARLEELTASVRSDETQKSAFEVTEKTLSKKLESLQTEADRQTREIQGAATPKGKGVDRLAEARKSQLELQRQVDAQQKAWQDAVQLREVSSAA